VITKKSHQNHNNCFVCGQQNPYSLGLKFTTNKQGETSAQFAGNSNLQGYTGILHGGIITTLLDAAMTNCLFDHGVTALTGDLQVRFLYPIPCNKTIKIQAKILTTKKPLYILQAEILYQKKVMARAKAKFIHIQ